MKFIQYARESIQFQNAEFADELIALCGKILAYPTPREAQASKEQKAIEKLIFDGTGILAKIKFDTNMAPAINVPKLNPQDILYTDFLNKLSINAFDEIVQKLDKPVLEGFIDLKRSKVGGFYSTVKFDIFAGHKFLKALKFTDRELAACLLHEIGHAYVLFEMLDRSCRTNQILAAMARASTDNPTDDLLKQRIVLVGKKSNFTDDQIEALKNSKSASVRQVLVLSYRNSESPRSELGTSNYHNVTYETLADNFAARHGLGRDMVSALERIGIHYGLPEHYAATRLALASLDILRTVTVGFTGFFMLAAGTVGGAVFGAFMLANIGFIYFLSGDDQRDFTYDDLKIRMRRIREQSIVYLKTRELPAEDVKRALADIDAIDEHLKKVSDATSINTKIANLILPGARKESKAIELQRDMELLAANDLFAKAASLSLLK